MNVPTLSISRVPAARPKKAPGPGIVGSLLQLPAFRRDPLATLLDWTRFGDVVRIGAGPRVFHLIRRPEHIAYVLTERQKSYKKSAIGYQELGAVLGQGLVTSEGATWREHRRIAQPAFHRQRLAVFARTMSEYSQATVESWRGCAEIDVAAEMMALTFRIVGKTLMGSDPAAVDEGTIADHVGVVMEHVADRMMRLVRWPNWIPTPGALRFRRSLLLFDRLVYDGIAERRADPTPRDDLMSMLMEARDEETGAGLSDRELRDEIVTMMGAGHETTANALFWTWRSLGANPEVERRLHEEVDRVLGGRAAELADLPQLRYTTAVIKESMRVHPPVWGISREALERDEIDGYEIPKGSVVLISPFVTHRHPELWPEPEAFRPERFLEPASEGPRLAYLPFGAGPRMCIGSAFAMMEATLILATIARAFRLIPGTEAPRLQAHITLRPSGGTWMKLEPR